MAKMNVLKAVILLLTITMLGGCSGKSANDYYKDGKEYFNIGNYEEAANNYEKAIKIKSDKAEYYIDYGMTLIKLGKYKEAIKTFNKAILKKDNLIVRENNKLALRGKGIAYYYTNQYKKAVQYFDKALKINELTDMNMDILYYKGSALEKSGQNDKAIQTYTKIIKANPSNAANYINRALVYSKMEEYEKSLADYDKAISKDKDNYDYYFGKYSLLSSLGMEDEANKVLTNASKIKVETEEDKFNLAKIHYYMGDSKAAIQELKEASSNGFAEANYFLGVIYEESEDYDSAVSNYELFLKDEKTTKSANVYNQIGVSLLKLGKYQEALEYVQIGLKLNDVTYQQPLKRNEIVLNEKLGNFEDAYKLVKEYIKRYPDDKEATTEYEFLKTRLPEVSGKK